MILLVTCFYILLSCLKIKVWEPCGSNFSFFHPDRNFCLPFPISSCLSRSHAHTHQSQNHSHKSHGHTPALSSTHEQSLSSKTTSWLCCPALLFIWKDCGLSASLSTTNCPTHAGGGEQHAHTGVLPLAQQASHDDNSNDDDVKDDDAGECCLQNIFFPFDLNMQCTPQRVKGHI